MELDIFIEFDENNNPALTLNLPFEFVDINDELYSDLSFQPFYIEKGLKLNKENLTSAINEMVNIIKDNFMNKNSVLENIIVSYRMADDVSNKDMIIEFLKQNKDFDITLNASKYDYLIKGLNEDDCPNLKISFKNNYDAIDFKKFHGMYKFLNEIISFVKHYNLSPLEQIMLVYDIIKSKEYTKEDKGEDIGLSRSLSEIISSGKIVCDGYSNLLNFILDELEIPNKKIYLSYTNKKSRHARNFIYLKDEKYNLDSFFVTDVTFDSKKEEENYLNNYFFFLRPLRFFSTKEEIIDSPKLLKFLRMSDEELEQSLTAMKSHDIFLTLLQFKSFLKEYNIDSFDYEQSDIEFEDIIKFTRKLFNKTISENAFKNALYKVRKIEYINGIVKHDITLEEIDEICAKIYKETPEVRLLKALNFYETPSLDKSIEEANSSSVEQDLLRMKLLRTLKAELQDLPQNEFIKKM